MNFTLLPLSTKVTDLRLFWTGYSITVCTNRFIPFSEQRFIPIFHLVENRILFPGYHPL